jgi:hypothetical protein
LDVENIEDMTGVNLFDTKDDYGENADIEILIPFFDISISDQLTFHGMVDSAAEAYADLFGLNFVCIT